MRPCLAGVPTGVCQLGLRLPISMLSRCQLQGDINFTIVLAPPHWAPLWSGLKVFVKTDSPVAAAILNKGSNGCLVIMGWIHSLFWLKKYYNFSMFIMMIQVFNQVCQGNKMPKKCAAPLNNTCCPFKFAKESLEVKLGTFMF